MQLVGETPVHVRVKPASLKVIVPTPPPAAAAPADDDEDVLAEAAAGEQVSEGVGKQEDSGGASGQASDGGVPNALIEASAGVEDKPIVAHTPKNE